MIFLDTSRYWRGMVKEMDLLAKEFSDSAGEDVAFVSYDTFHNGKGAWLEVHFSVPSIKRKHFIAGLLSGGDMFDVARDCGVLARRWAKRAIEKAKCAA